MAASISKDQIVEFISKRRDVLVLAAIVILAAWGYHKLREPLAKTVDQSIEEAVSRGASKQSVEAAKTLKASDLVNSLGTQRPLSMYRHNRSPFGTPAEQMRLRQEVQQLYQRGVDLYKAEQYELALQQFNRVARLDVTETRIQYPVPPSEYIRQCDQRLKMRNLDSILTKAGEEIQRADGLQSSSPSEAVGIYESALLTLKGIVSVDPQGEAMGKEKFDQVSTQVAQLTQTVTHLKRQTLGRDVDTVVSALDSALQQASSNVYGVLLALARGREVQKEVQEVDADGTVVAASKRTQLDSLAQTAEKTLASSLESVARQAQTRMSDAVQKREFAAAHECVKAFGDLCTRYPDNRTLLSAQAEVMTTYVGGLLEAGSEEIKKITEAFQKGDYTSYDPQAKEVLLGHVSTAVSLGSVLTDTDRNQLGKLEDTLRRIKPPPALDSVYELASLRSTSSGYRVRLRETITGKEISLSLRLNVKDKSGFYLTEVDSRNGVVILSKPPEYAPSQFKMP